MNYAFNITTPAQTPETNKLKTVMKLFRGLINKVEIQFPPGPAGLLHVHINRANHQVWPANAESHYIGDDQTIVIPAKYELDQPPFQFECFTWNEDDTFDHLVIIRFDIELAIPEQLLTPEYLAAQAELRGEL